MFSLCSVKNFLKQYNIKFVNVPKNDVSGKLANDTAFFNSKQTAYDYLREVGNTEVSIIVFPPYKVNIMVITCSAQGCSARKDSNFTKTSLQFHRFPLRKPDVLAKWVKAMKNPNFKPTVKTYLCSAHFAASDYEMKPANGGKHLKSNAVPSIFEKRRPGRKKKLLSENEISDEIKENEDESLEKNEADDIIEEEYLEANNSDKEESNLVEIIGNQEKETLQILIVGEDGKITNSEYILKKEFFPNEGPQSVNPIKDEDSDDENINQSKKQVDKYHHGKVGDSSEISLLNYKDLRNQVKIKRLEMSLLSTKKKVKVLQVKCRKMNKKLNRLKILLKLLVLKRGKGEKNLKQLLEEYEKELEDMKVKVKEEESSDF